MKRTCRYVSIIVLSVLCLGFLGFHNQSASAEERVIIDIDSLQYAFSCIEGLNSIVVASAPPSNATVSFQIDFNGKANLYVVGSTAVLAPTTAGNILAIESDAYYRKQIGYDKKYYKVQYLFSGNEAFGNESLASVTEIDLWGLDTSTMTTATAMFAYLPNLERINLTGLDFGSTTDFSEFFSGCTSLREIIIDWRQANTVSATNLGFMFQNCTSLDSINLQGMNTARVNTVSSMFAGCKGLTNIDLSKLNLSSVTKADGLLSGTGISSFSFAGTNMSNVTEYSGFFANCPNLTTVDLNGIDTRRTTDFDFFFCNCPNLASIDLSPLNTSSAKNFQNMFENCTKLSSIDLHTFDTRKVTDMSSMFSGCTALQSVDLTSFGTDQVTTFVAMFKGCTALETVDLSTFSALSASGLGEMFSGCSSLRTVTFGDFLTSKVTSMGQMFLDCTSLETIDLHSFSCEKLSSAHGMFQGCTALKSVNLNGFNTITNTEVDLQRMFYNCNSIQNISMMQFEFPSQTNGLFTNMFGGLDPKVAYTFVSICCSDATREALKSHTGFSGITNAHSYQNGKCQYCGKCQTNHQSFSNGVCTSCGMCQAVINNGQHNFVDGVCQTCQAGGHNKNECMGLSVILKDKVELAVAFSLSDALLRDSTTYVEFTCQTATGNEVTKVYLKDAMPLYVNGEILKSFRYSLPAKQMTDTVSVRLINTNQSVSTTLINLSVKQYALQIINGNYDQKTKNLAKAMLGYGAYAQRYFNYRTDNLADAGVDYSIPSVETVKEGLSGYSMYCRTNVRGISFYGANLSLDGDLVVDLYYSFDSSITSSTQSNYRSLLGLDYSHVKTINNQTYFYRGVTGWSVGVWDQYYETSGGVITVKYCPLVYMNDVMNISDNAALIDLVRAMYGYWTAAKAYQN